jgi:hypothetical protein
MGADDASVFKSIAHERVSASRSYEVTAPVKVARAVLCARGTWAFQADG